MPRQSTGESRLRQEWAAAADSYARESPAAAAAHNREQERKAARKPVKPATPATNGTVIRPDPVVVEPHLNLGHGRLASTLARSELRWFVDGWFAHRMINVVIGRKNVGKSSLMAWLLAKAARPLILPGYEESVELMMLPRWTSAGVNLRTLKVLDDRHYLPSLQVDLLVRVLRQHRADLLVVENLDSYLPPDASTNDSQAVRPYLESLHQIAVQSGVCLVGTRHPGKDPANLCPGSHCWEDVPRISVVLSAEGNPATRYWQWSHRCGVGRQPEPLVYTLPCVGASAPVFTLIATPDADALRVSQQAPDPVDRSRLQAAMDLLAGLLREEWVESREVFAAAERERLGEGTIRRAALILGVQTKRDGEGLNHKGWWARKGLDTTWAASDLP